MDWQPIETAPKDGSWIAVCKAGEHDSIECGYYKPFEIDAYEPAGDGLFRKVRQSVPWCDWGPINNFHRATHWMPLPAPPELQA